MQVAILTFDGFNELDSLIALGILDVPASPASGLVWPVRLQRSDR